jgi:hypothetical protein
LTDLYYFVPGERIRRDRRHQFYQEDKKHGYYDGPTGTWRDYVDPNLTTMDVLKIGFEESKKQARMAKEDVLWALGRHGRAPFGAGQYRSAIHTFMAGFRVNFSKLKFGNTALQLHRRVGEKCCSCASEGVPASWVRRTKRRIRLVIRFRYSFE